MKPVRIGIIGCGLIANTHCQKYAEIPGVEVIAACDIVEETLHSFSDRYKIPNRYTNIGELLERDDIDAVDVCLHNNLHEPVTVEALKMGKHVYCEKPIAANYADGLSMLSTAKECGRMLHIQLNYLYEKETIAAKRLIDAGKLGRIYHARSTGFRRRGRPYVDGYGSENFVKLEVSGGGALYDMGVYRLTQILYLLGMPRIERIVGRTYQETGMHQGRKEHSGYSVDELGMGFVHFEGGLTMDVIESWAIHLDNLDASCIVGSEAGIKLNPLSYHTTMLDLEMDAKFNLDSMLYRINTLEENSDIYASSQKHWVAALQGRVELLPTAQIALQAQIIMDGIYLSTRLGREVTAEEVISTSRSTSLPVHNLKPQR